VPWHPGAVDWYLPPAATADASLLRREIGAYLARHADSADGVDGAQLIVSELVGNALRHAEGPCWVSVRWTGEQPVLTVVDLGAGFVPDTALPPAEHAGGRGMFLVDHFADRFEVAARDGGGTVASATLPVHRRPETSWDPPRSKVGSLPGLEEARPEGGFGRETFLRALVVQLAQGLESEHGPDAAERAVAQVGADVGGQMEAEYRAATGATGPLDPEHLAACYVRLKAAIGGGFSVESIEGSRITLVNDRCPFGDAVLKAPALCRMTSSVFGGIAANNGADGAVVLLEERIAVGDPGCRVVVDLAPDAATPPSAHRYAAAATH
jgi:anti-sigma regulatory factor (Ser/Thr protein kinase)